MCIRDSLYLRERIALSAAAAAAALLVKPTASIFPLLLVLVDVATRQPLRRVLPRIALLGAVVAAFTVLSGRMTPAFAIRSASGFTRVQYLRSELPAIWHY